ncbi:MAG: DUF1549 domain-containing protein [Polyangiaceae bacterium]
MMRRISMLFGLAVGAVLAAAACDSSPTGTPTGSGSGTTYNHPVTDGTDNPEASRPAVTHTVLDQRVKDYNEALRTASLKLVRALPTLEQIKKVQSSSDPRRAYEEELDKMLEDPRFTLRMIKWWKDTMRMAGGANGDAPSRNTAPNLAARITVEGRPMTDLFTQASNNCPEYDTDTNQFVDGECNNGVPTEAGVLTNPGVQYQFYGNMAFRRVRWIQETFVCTKFPAEYSDKPQTKNGADYVSPWPFESIATAPIDFQDTKSVVCANCHTTINHIAPMFGHFDKNGKYTDAFAVMTPTADPVPTELSHWLQPGETMHWRFGEEVKDFAELGAAIAADPDVNECVVTRLYNFAMSKEDVVNDLATVPYEVMDEYMIDYYQSGMNLKATLRAMFTGADFIRF